MSSTGIITNSKATTTSIGETQRQTERAVASIPGLNEGSRVTAGTIKEVHKNKPRLIKVYADDGTVIANNDWIELNHSAQEIAERWGTVRVGFRVRVRFTGPSGASADATIIGVEQENVKEPPIPNEAARSLYSIFAPGAGI